MSRLNGPWLANLPAAALANLESRFQMAQGKGWGTSTVTKEVAAVRQLPGDAAASELVVVDAGARFGDWTIEALRVFPRASIHCFEPSAMAFDRLSSTLGSEPRVSLHNIALSDSHGTAVLYANEPGSELGSLTKRRLDHHGIESRHEEQVTTRTLESWTALAGVDHVDVLKLDIEGYELAALQGAGGLLAGVRVIQFEFGGCNIDTRTFFQDFWYLLTDAGFRLHRLGPIGLHTLDRYSERDECFSTTNYLASLKQRPASRRSG